jgi:mannose-6-phosphate isomerase-like protein (cupin superfamily)
MDPSRALLRTHRNVYEMVDTQQCRPQQHSNMSEWELAAPCNQAQDEWVLLLQGTTSLEIDNRTITLGVGDTIFIPAHTSHREVKTSKEPQCVWLAVHVY